MSASQSPDGFDEDLSDFDDFDNPPTKRAKKGKGASKGKNKANSNTAIPEEGNDTASTRKLQNRVAQREFRQRKLQYVKDLEARVEFLSSSKDDQLEALKAMLRGMLDENKQLRSMLQTVTTFVGDGIGGLTSKVGIKDHMDIDTFMEFVARGDRQTLITLYDNWKDRKEAGATDVMGSEDTEKAGTSGSKGKSRDTTNDKTATGWSSQKSSRANSPVNNTSTNLTEGGSSRKRGRNDKSNSTGTGSTQSPSEKPSSQNTATTKQNNSASNVSKQAPASAQSQIDHSGPASTQRYGFNSSPLSASATNSSNMSSFNTASTSNPQPPAAYKNYMEMMAAATAPSLANTATNFNHSFYTQQQERPNQNTMNENNSTWQNYPNYGWLPGPSNAQGQQGSNNHNSTNGNGSNAFFFDTAEPMSMPTSSFTNDFLNQFIHTGLTPLLDPSQQSSLFPWSSNSVDPQQGNAHTPASSTSSMNQIPSPLDQNQSQNTSTQAQQSMQSQANGFVPQLSLGQNHLQNQTQHQQQQQQQQQAPMLPPQIYNPLASPRSSLPSIPPGFSPDELINSNPLLAAIHIISFHLRNKAANANYVLPPALEPTPQQSSTPHDFRLDGILHREWRTRLLSKIDFNINELLADLMQASTVHPGDNLLDPANWEVSETFLRKYKHTITPDVLSDSNKWRRSRGEPEIVL